MLTGALAGLFALAGCGGDGFVPVEDTGSPSVTTTTSTSPSGSGSGSASVSPSVTSSPTPTTLQQAFAGVSSGVIRLEVSTCTSGATGTGFAIDDVHLVTAAHVIDNGALVRAISDTSSQAAQVIGIDRELDVALLRVTKPLTGHVFSFASTPAKVGDAVAALGYPQAAPLAFSPGTVNGINRKVVVEGSPRYDLVEFDSATTHGGSGGPLIRTDGQVVGVVVAGQDGVDGRKFALDADRVRDAVTPWLKDGPIGVKQCAKVAGPDGEPVPSGVAPGSDLDQVFGTLRLYFNSINQGDYPTGLAQFVKPLPLDVFVDGVETSFDTNFTIKRVTRAAAGNRIDVQLTFTSVQRAGEGPAARPQETCTDWSLNYVMRPANGLWLIDQVLATGTASAPCAVRPGATPRASATATGAGEGR